MHLSPIELAPESLIAKGNQKAKGKREALSFESVQEAILLHLKRKDLIKNEVKLILVIDEIDSFSHSSEDQALFNSFLRLLLTSGQVNVIVIGIANSVELFKGELTKNASLSKKVICKNEEKIIFPPYTSEEFVSIIETHLSNFLCIHYARAKHELYEALIDMKAVKLAASKVEKLNGDIRVVFTILSNAV